MLFTRPSLFWSATTPTFLPFSLPSVASRLTSTLAALSLVVSGVRSNPFGDWSIHGCSSSWPMCTVLCSLVRQSRPWPVKSMNTPTTANTLSSSVHDVHSDSGSGFRPGMGWYVL